MTDGGIIALIVGASTLVVALTNLFKPFKRLKAGLDARKAKNKLIHSAVITADGVNKRLDSIDRQLGQMSDRQQAMATDLKETIDHNRRQDAEIRRSLAQRQLHDSALFALLDASHKAGNNGPVTRARQELLDHIQKEANAPIDRKE